MYMIIWFVLMRKLDIERHPHLLLRLLLKFLDLHRT